MIVKDRNLTAYRVSTQRDVEDWRKEPATKREGAWAVHCIEHDQRTFYPTYAKAKDYAPFPEACSVCQTFDRRCVYCPSNDEQWLTDRNAGFVPSVGQITGNAVCAYHKYGAIPEDIDYQENPETSTGKTIVEIVAEQPDTRSKLITISFQPEQQTYSLQCHFASDCVPAEQGATYSRALNFALSVVASLKAALKREATNTPESLSFGYFETWEQVAARQSAGK